MKKVMVLTAFVLLVSVILWGCASVTGRTVGEHIDDSSITSEINAKIVADKELSYFKINVDTFQGNVTLTGKAPNKEAEARLIRLCKEVIGVKSVKSNLIIGK